jgi:hypothetical protein
MIEEEEILEVSFLERLRFGVRAAWHMVTNRPIVCYFDDNVIYAKTNPFYLKAVASRLDELANDQIAEDAIASFRNLLEVPQHRNN